MRADNRGEGGILALLALALESARSERSSSSSPSAVQHYSTATAARTFSFSEAPTKGGHTGVAMPMPSRKPVLPHGAGLGLIPTRAAVLAVMSAWRTGHQLLLARVGREAVPLASFLATCEEAPEARVSGAAVYLTTQTPYVRATLLHNLKPDKVLHRAVLLVRVVTGTYPGSRAQIGSRQATSEAGFGRSRWREHLYSSLVRIATRPTEFFRIPPDRVIELGAEVEICVTAVNEVSSKALLGSAP